mmetsp:Transcript_6386/g.24008  ORF Transcript_6386/g.24008 Transcript_6386/m.24008 type:complete len:92 (-) Transcript_6386:1419-1694(-)
MWMEVGFALSSFGVSQREDPTFLMAFSVWADNLVNFVEGHDLFCAFSKLPKKYEHYDAQKDWPKFDKTRATGPISRAHGDSSPITGQVAAG